LLSALKYRVAGPADQYLLGIKAELFVNFSCKYGSLEKQIINMRQCKQVIMSTSCNRESYKYCFTSLASV